MIKDNIEVKNKEFVDGSNEKEVNKEINKSYKATSIEIGKNEVDIRDLSARDIKQLNFRNQTNTLAYLKFMNMSMNNIELCLLAIVEKLYGRPADEVLEDLVEKNLPQQNTEKN